MDRKMLAPGGSIAPDGNGSVALQAVQGLLVAIEALGLDVCRCQFSDRQLFIVSVPAPSVPAQPSHLSRRLVAPQTEPKTTVLIVYAACAWDSKVALGSSSEHKHTLLALWGLLPGRSRVELKRDPRESAAVDQCAA